MLKLASCYAVGNGIKKNLKKAFIILDKASAHGDPGVVQMAKDQVERFLRTDPSAAAFAPLLGAVTLKTDDEHNGLKCTL